MSVDEIEITQLGLGEAGELLTLQRAAYATEAQIYGDPFLPALTQSLDELTAEMTRSIVFGVRDGDRLVGSVRVHVSGTVAEVGRLVVAPDQQGRGLGTSLMTHVHSNPPSRVESFELFTGHRSQANIGLYLRLGYTELRREPMSDDVELVFLARPVSC